MKFTTDKMLLIQFAALVLVSCSHGPTYSIGGTVSGLQGQLVLQNNGVDQVTITSEGSFAFAGKLNADATYEVSVTTDPAGQNCAVENGTGRISANDVTDISVVCESGAGSSKVWSYPLDYSDHLTSSAEGDVLYPPQVAVNDAGEKIVVWCESDGARGLVFMSHYQNGAWSTPISPNATFTVDGQYCDDAPQAAMDDHGNIVVAWAQSDGSNNQVFISEYRNGAWTHPPDASGNISPNDQDAFRPRIAMDNDANAIVAWYQHDGSFNRIFKSEYRSGTWVHPADASDSIGPEEDSADPELAMDNNGNAIIVWKAYDGNNDQIFKSEYRNGAWAHPSSLSDNLSPASEDATNVKVVMSDSGSALVVWLQSDGSDRHVFKSEYQNGAWIHPAFLADNLSLNGQDAKDPAVAIDQDGNGVIVWTQSDGEYDQIFLSENRTGAWETPTSAHDNMSPDSVDSQYAKVAMDDQGQSVVMWQQQDSNGDAKVAKAEYRAGAWVLPSSPDDHINFLGLSGRAQEQGNVAMTSDGEAILAWRGYNTDMTGYRVFIAEYR